jgi:general secretion pathway protein G
MLPLDSTDGVAGASSGDEPHPFPSSEEPQMLHTLRQARAGVTNRLDEARKTNRRLAEAGFTLIELLIVIVILGILAAVVVFSVSGITDRGNESACEAEATTINTAVQAFYAKNKAWPTDLASLAPGFLATDPTDGLDFDTVSVDYDATTHIATCS